jgi:hypothetical protein
MKTTLLYAFCCVVLLSGAQSLKADMINYDYVSAADGTLTTPYSWAIVDTFDSSRPGWNYTGGAIVSGSVVANYATPYGDITNYFTVYSPCVDSGTIATVSFGGSAYNYLGLFWGSADAYNKIELFNGSDIIATYTGLDVAPPANGNQSSPDTNRYVNLFFSQEFDSIRLTSTTPAFEIDNLAAGLLQKNNIIENAPVPGAALLGIIGMAFSGLKLNRKQK